MKTHFLLVFQLLLLSPTIFGASFTFKKLGEVPRSAKSRETLEQKIIPKNVKDWQELKEINGPKQKYESPKKQFTIESGLECSGESCGDAARYKFTLKRKNGAVEKFGNQWIGSLQVTSDDRYIIFERFEIIDTLTWKKVPIDPKFLESAPYLNLAKYSPSQNKLLVWGAPCIADCQNETDTLWEVQLP